MIPRLWLDYRRPPPGRHRTGWIVLSVVALAGVLLLADYAAVNNGIDDLEARLARASAASAAEAEAGTLEGGEAVALPAARWESLFAALESAGDETVTLLSLRPGPGELQLNGEAGNNNAAVDYAARLNATAAFDSVNLTQTEVMREHPQQPVRFAVRAQWGRAP